MRGLGKKALAAAASCCLALSALTAGVSAESVSDISVTTSDIWLYLDKPDVTVDGNVRTLETPAQVIGDKLYVPAKFLGDELGFRVAWNEVTRTIEMTPPDYTIVLDSDNGKVTVNGVELRFADVAAIVGGKLLVKLTWLADYMGVPYAYNAGERRVEIRHVRPPKSLYLEQEGNSNPVARFETAKRTYRLGEPVEYIDLSYDPDSEGFAPYRWQGRQEAFFQPGRYPVSLQVKDQHGHLSEPYIGYVTVVNEPYWSPALYPLYTKPPGAIVPLNPAGGDWSGLPQASRQEESALEQRRLVVSGGQQALTQAGILYQDVLEPGRLRLLAHQVNASNQRLTLALLVTNESEQPVTVHTTSVGAEGPSPDAGLVMRQLSADLLSAPATDRQLTVPPKGTYIYSQLPYMDPGEAVAQYADVELDGPLRLAVVAVPALRQSALDGLPLLAGSPGASGAFPQAEARWRVDGPSVTGPQALTLGDGVIDRYVQGRDGVSGLPVENVGNAGVVYRVHVDKPGRMAVLVRAAGGTFQGTVKAGGSYVNVPLQGGLLSALDGAAVLARTDGTAAALDLAYTPVPGSVQPIELIFYPLPEPGGK
ncbi:copper amine oxidase N-terminal domain-containing protein [Paenibacillus athensensis]|uniref:Copper amine oxidase-like N-terminal domain-containing protein n=1 Tax=Paenibacillus athensensis TaxID=1967502 RepID=A0A4Y8PZC8_9BACL|nr:copper amine oxidase N-terminal domain-containing protein [Paenibacillus athensensis]MCD1258522.1 copper amine oxidase N-terminal domain-containing protein [Paenibacillus athensensis]